MNGNRHLAMHYMATRETKEYFGEPKIGHKGPNHGGGKRNACKRYSWTGEKR